MIVSRKLLRSTYVLFAFNVSVPAVWLSWYAPATSAITTGSARPSMLTRV
ncbi:MAG: hypothetical protein ACT443_08660 [Gemmatimonadota bacterium]